VGGGWGQAHGLSDEALAGRIEADGIDVLVECSGHSAGSRIGMVAGRVAPVQATTLLGHGGTTGVAAVDYILADEVVAPAGSEGEFSEAVVRLPGVFAPFRPDPGWPEVAEEGPGPVVFGCFGDPARIGSELLAAWGRILEAVPGSRLLLKHRSYEDGEMAVYWRERLKGLGERVEFEGIAGGWERHMGVYGRVGVMLDTYPVTGASTTAIPLWMGIPVVTRAGGRVAERFGAAILTAAGMPELVAGDRDGYEALAIALGRDRERRRSLRASLRTRLKASALTDAAGAARAHERAYRAMWIAWCRQAGEQ
jgi:predicted O-linked N-acetylglucosamine transferase (SPINDLY family)